MNNKNDFINCFDITFTNSNSDILLNDILELLKLTNNERLFLRKKNEEYNLLENFVHDISNFILSKVETENKDKIEVSFNLLNSYNKMHLEFEGIPINPIASLILYLNNNDKDNDYSLLTSINNSSYKYKDYYYSNNKFYFVNPKKLKLIRFDTSKYYHNHYSVNDKLNIVLIHLWKINNPIELNRYNNNNAIKNTRNINLPIKINESNCKCKLDLEKVIINKRDFYDNIFYTNNKHGYNFLHKSINDNIENSLEHYDFVHFELLNGDLDKINNKTNNDDNKKKLNSIKFEIPS